MALRLKSSPARNVRFWIAMRTFPHAPPVRTATWALPLETEHWLLTMLREKLLKVGAKVVRHGRYIMAEVAIPRPLFAEILRLIDGLAPRRLSCYGSRQPPGVIWAISGKSNWR